MKKLSDLKFINDVNDERAALLSGEQREVKCEVCERNKIYVDGKLIIDCDCQFKPDIIASKKRIEQRKLNDIFNRSLTNPDVKEASFESSDIQITDSTLSFTEKTPYIKAFEFINNFSTEKKKNQNLILEGTTGTGKSFLAYSIGRELKDRGYTVLFIDIVELLMTIKNTFNKSSDETEMEILNLIAKVDLLILDDVGANKQTDWAVEKLYDITNKRQGKNTIFTTNLSVQEMKAEREPLLNRCYSRMLNKATIVKMYGVDRRTEGIE